MFYAASYCLLRIPGIPSPLCSRTLHFQKTFFARALRSSQVAGSQRSVIFIGSRYSFASFVGQANIIGHPLGQSSTLQLVRKAVQDATRRSRISRIPPGPLNQSKRGPTRRKKPEGKLRRILNSIPPHLIVWGILGLHGAVFAMWLVGVEQLQKGDKRAFTWMSENFTSSIGNFREGRYWTLLTCCISHLEPSHLMVNTFTFCFMAPEVLRLIGSARFLALYIGGGIFSSLVSLYWRSQVKHNENWSCGASGAIYSFMSFFACILPKQMLAIWGVVPCPAWVLVSGLFVWDSYSAIYDQRIETDTAAHVGGIFAGVGYYFLKTRFAW